MEDEDVSARDILFNFPVQEHEGSPHERVRVIGGRVCDCVAEEVNSTAVGGESRQREEVPERVFEGSKACSNLIRGSDLQGFHAVYYGLLSRIAAPEKLRYEALAGEVVFQIVFRLLWSIFAEKQEIPEPGHGLLVIYGLKKNRIIKKR